jgi:hypothetical protein
MPKAASPALSTGTGSGVPATDQRCFTRPQCAGYDIGTVERRLNDPDAPLILTLFLPEVAR